MLQNYKDEKVRKQIAMDIQNALSSLKVVPNSCKILPYRKVPLKIHFKPVGMISTLNAQVIDYRYKLWDSKLVPSFIYSTPIFLFLAVKYASTSFRKASSSIERLCHGYELVSQSKIASIWSRAHTGCQNIESNVTE